ncbi:MAG: hypothetical protein M1818_007480 [Claussenomyces sp. TS43310]|nr:MAG: hypothetical protein M1818_007480 [Claussenomyces sp. TS43310]
MGTDAFGYDKNATSPSLRNLGSARHQLRNHRQVSRIERLEQALSHVTAELAHQRPGSSNVSDRIASPKPVSSSISTTTVPNDLRSTPSQSPSGLTPSVRHDVFDQGILTQRYAGALLNEFRVMAQHFPYVVLPAVVSVDDMRCEAPMLLLSILATASWRDRMLQAALEQAYLQALAARMVIEGEQSLDMLQSLLVHLAWYSLALRKAGSLGFSDYLEECASSLSRESHVASDLTIAHYVHVTRLAESIGETFGHGEQQPVAQISEGKLRFCLNSIDAQRRALESKIPPELADNIMLSASHLLVEAYAHEIALPSSSNLPLSTYRTTLLFDSLKIVKQILDLCVSLSDRDFQSLMGFNWARIHYTLNLTIELTVGIESPSWDIDMVRRIVKLESYLDLFCERLDLQSQTIRMNEGDCNWYQFVAVQWRSLRRQYMSRLWKRGVRLSESEERQIGLEAIPTATIPPPLDPTRVHNLEDMDFSSIDIMPNDWFWPPPDPKILPSQTF